MKRRGLKGLPALPDQLGRRGSRWVRARVPVKKANSGLSFADPMVEEVAKNIFEVAAKQQAGKFKSQRENDVLTVALGNLEHPGRVLDHRVAQCSHHTSIPEYCRRCIIKTPQVST